MRLLKVLGAYSSALVLMTFCAAALAAGPAPAHITIGTLYASSGPYAPISTPVYRGLKLWVQTVNAGGGAYIKPYGKKIPIDLIAYNDQSSTTTAATLYNRLITQDHVDILTADSGSVLTSVAVPLAEEHKVLLFDQTGTSVKFFTKNNPYIVFLADPVTRLWSKPLTHFLEKDGAQHGIHRVAILYSTNDFCGPQAISLNKDLTKDSKNNSKVKVVYFHGVPTSTSSYTVLLHRIESTHPDAVIEFGYPDNDIAFLRDLHATGAHFPMVFTSYAGLETALLRKNVGAQTMRGLFTYVTALDVHYNPTAGMDIDQFEAAYHKKYGKDVTIGFNAIAGYSDGVIIQQTLANTTGMGQLALRKAIFALSGKLTTLNGHFKLASDGAQIGMHLPIGQIQYHGGHNELIPLYPPQVKRGEPVWHAAP